MRSEEVNHTFTLARDTMYRSRLRTFSFRGLIDELSYVVSEVADEGGLVWRWPILQDELKHRVFELEELERKEIMLDEMRRMR